MRGNGRSWLWGAQETKGVSSDRNKGTAIGIKAQAIRNGQAELWCSDEGLLGTLCANATTQCHA